MLKAVGPSRSAVSPVPPRFPPTPPGTSLNSTVDALCFLPFKRHRSGPDRRYRKHGPAFSLGRRHKASARLPGRRAASLSPAYSSPDWVYRYNNVPCVVRRSKLLWMILSFKYLKKSYLYTRKMMRSGFAIFIVSIRYYMVSMTERSNSP